MLFPARFQTGVRNTTVPNPAQLHSKNPKAYVFEGLASEYDFRKQLENYAKLEAVLQANGRSFLWVAGAYYPAVRNWVHFPPANNHRFNAVADDGSLLWHKYVGMEPMGGQNHVFVAGMRIKVSMFLELNAQQQTALLENSRYQIAREFTPQKLKWLDEANELWS